MNERWAIFHRVEENKLVSLQSEKVSASLATKSPHSFPLCCMWRFQLINPGEVFLSQRKRSRAEEHTLLRCCGERGDEFLCINHMRFVRQLLPPLLLPPAVECFTWPALFCKQRSKQFYIMYCWNKACVSASVCAEQKGNEGTICETAWKSQM